MATDCASLNCFCIVVVVMMRWWDDDDDDDDDDNDDYGSRNHQHKDHTGTQLTPTNQNNPLTP